MSSLVTEMATAYSVSVYLVAAVLFFKSAKSLETIDLCVPVDIIFAARRKKGGYIIAVDEEKAN